jgi:steroid delta-isomerase-like uncharacterized protein
MTQQQVTPSHGADPQWLEGFVQEWTDAWNSHEADRLLALMTDDIVYDDSAWPRQMRGHADVREFLKQAWTGLPDMRFEETEGSFPHPTEPKAMFYWRGTATHTGPIDPPGLKPTGRSVEFEGADFHEYRDGKVCRLRIVFDMADVMRQLGVLPQAGGREERVMSKVANVRGKLPGHD